MLEAVIVRASKGIKQDLITAHLNDLNKKEMLVYLKEYWKMELETEEYNENQSRIIKEFICSICEDILRL